MAGVVPVEVAVVVVVKTSLQNPEHLDHRMSALAILAVRVSRPLVGMDAGEAAVVAVRTPDPVGVEPAEEHPGSIPD